jgi:DMSO/TMAO reductase YedYZ molybdopterin-dependent catalytic subunit
MRYQDPPAPGSPDPGRRPLSDRAGARHQGSHQRRPDYQDLRPDPRPAPRRDWDWDREQPGDQDLFAGRSRDTSAGQSRDTPAGRTRSLTAGAPWDPWTQGADLDYGPSRVTVVDSPYPGTGWDVPAEPGWQAGGPGRPPAEPDRLPRGGRGRLAGAVTGILAAAIALGVAMLVSAFIRPQASPVIAVGGAVIDLTPTPLKEFAVAHFGQDGKTMLLAGMYVVIAGIAMVIGGLARRRVAAGVVGIGLFGVLGAVVALVQPGHRATDAIPALAGGVAGVIAIIALVKGTGPAGPIRALSPAGPRGPIDRRKFLVIGSAAAAVAAVSAMGGQLLTSRRFNASASRAKVKLAAPAAKTPVLPKAGDLHIPGLSSFYTPNADFYRVDTALVIPQVTTQRWSLRVHGMVGTELNISFDDLLKMPMIERDITIMCVSDTVGGNYIGNARWQGVLLSDVLRGARLKPGISQLATTDVNGMTIGVATDVALDGRDTMLAVGMNGVPLPQEHGFPVRLVVPGLYGYCSATKWITDMNVTTLAAFDAYWVQRRWSQVGVTKTESRIDTPKAGASLTAGPVTVAGVAWAQHRGIEQVEVAIDEGDWTTATLAAQDTVDTWRQWYLPWQATAGPHTLQVRATDKTGYTQTATNVPTFPNGATGYHTIQVKVA